MKVAVIGTGYVGLVTGVCLADSGHDVVCVDNNTDKVAALRAGNTPIFEPGLSDVLARNLKAGKISFTAELSEGVAAAEVVFLALPTPPQEDGSADLSAVLAVAKSLGTLKRPRDQIIVNKSTVPVGTAQKVAAVMQKAGGKNFTVVSNPEFLREGFAIDDFMHPERIVVGTDNPKAAQVMAELYAPFTAQGYPLISTDTTTAELAKYAANAFLATKISFMNEIANICEVTNADVDALRYIIGSDSRIGQKFLYPGIGYGGSCFPKDVRALRHMSQSYGYDFKIMDAVVEVNAQQHEVLTNRLLDHFDGSLKDKTIAVWGLAFKPNTDDIREAPALAIIDRLLGLGATIRAYDPEAMGTVRAHFKDVDKITLVSQKYDAVEAADALLIATEWQEFKDADLGHIKKLLNQPVICDGRNLFQRTDMQRLGFAYYSIGRAPVTAA